jgi:hypothetical protein
MSDGILVIGDESTGTKDSINLSQHNTILSCTEYVLQKTFSIGGNKNIIYGDGPTGRNRNIASREGIPVLASPESVLG